MARARIAWLEPIVTVRDSAFLTKLEVDNTFEELHDT